MTSLKDVVFRTAIQPWQLNGLQRIKSEENTVNILTLQQIYNKAIHFASCGLKFLCCSKWGSVLCNYYGLGVKVMNYHSPAGVQYHDEPW